ncbi:type II secretion system protein J [Alkalihalobacillus sp. AL-G]|uniref:PulJ/GspJ family protein n=1 Tax=Alkalihalobacillus sp. AL-G TaxID=2926399 RepID=UPI00272D6AC2|nr:prepilin-type N-terminal cleavage/methylation domain-containing protein [Alkalihalobacillus sp. AL-G]WLD92253.1 prepilin-type N-terminal cleavage/methylation domain-containing protein [Alkalihalobacillus sp. AL-G]
MIDQRGMTLIELLATIAIFSMIVGVSYSLFSYVQASWTITETAVSSESDVQELKMVLTREVAAPVSLTKSAEGVRFESQDGSSKSMVIQAGELKLFKYDAGGSNQQLLHDFALSIDRMELLDQNKNPVHNGTGLTEGIAYFRFFYTTEGLKEKHHQITLPIDIFSP